MPNHLSNRVHTYVLHSFILFFALNFIEFKSSASVLISGGTSPAVLSGNPYTTLASAINALNSGGILTAPVFVDISAGHTETLTSRITLTLTGTPTNPIIIQKSGIGANPKLISFVGTNATPSSTADGMFAFAGCDYVTIDGLDLQENIANTTPTTVMEFGYGLFKASASDGAQNNCIKNCTIKLNRTQNANWSTTGNTGSVAIIVNNSTNTTTTAITTATVSGSNSFNKFYANTINDCNEGIAIVGYAAPAPYILGDTGNDVGGNSFGTGNTIFNFGGATSAANPSNGLFATNQWDLNCSFNTIISNDGAGVNHPNILRGIFLNTPSNGASLNCNQNIIIVKGGGTTHEVSGISINLGSTGNSGTLNANGNNISGEYSSATNGIFYGINLNSTVTNVNIKNNWIHDIGNSISSNAGAGSISLIYYQGSAMNAEMSGNILSNVSRNGINSGGIAGISCASANLRTIRNNSVSNMVINGSGASSSINGIYITGSGDLFCDSNQISNLTIAYSSGMPLYGINSIGSPSNESFNANTIFNLTNYGTGATHGLRMISSANGTRTVSNNTIYSIIGNGFMLLQATEVAGMVLSSASSVVFKNKIYDIISNATTSSLVTGISVGYVSEAGSCNIYNNLIGLLKAPFVSVATPATPTIRGVNLTSIVQSNFLLSDNTIYLNSSSTGANFGTAGVYHTSAFADSSNIANLTMRNNVIYNNSIASGTGIVSAYQRSSSNKRTYNSLSDRNLFYAGIPAANQLIFTDTVVSKQTLSDYKSTMATIGADQFSYTGNIVFQSVVGSSPDFLKFDTLTPSILESAGSNIAEIIDDYSGSIRQGNLGYSGSGSMPDLGAWELNGIALNGCTGIPFASNAMSTNLYPCTSTFTLSLNINYGLGFSMQWEESVIGASTGFSIISGATNPLLVTTTSITKWYRCVITCVSSGQSTISSPVMITIAPLLGNYYIDNTGVGNYISVYEAITDLNCKGSSGPVVFNIVAGQVFNETNNLNCTYTATLANPITFVKSGIGANPIIRRSGTSSTTNYVLKLSGVDYYTFDGIDFEQTGSSTSNYVEFGIHIANITATNGAMNNTFRNGKVTVTNQTTASKGVYIQSEHTPIAASGTNSGNRFLNMTIQNAFEGYRVTESSSAFLDEANEINIDTTGNPSVISVIQNIGSNSLSGVAHGVYGENQKNFILSNTEIKNISASGTDNAIGIRITGNPVSSLTISNNRFHDFFSPNTSIGVSLGSVIVADVINNSVYTMNSTGFAAIGISVIGSNLLSNVSNNKVYNLNTSSTIAGYALGIGIGSGLFTVSNNLISDLHAGACTITTGGTKGISITTPASTCRIFHNSIYLNDIGTVAAYTSAGIYIAPTSASFDIRNNVIVNKSNVSTGTRAVALWKAGTTDNIDNASNNNLWYAGTPSTKNLIYYDGSNAIQTIAAYKLLSAITPAESNAVTENVNFAPITNGVLRPNATTPTFIEGGALLIAGFTTDFEGDNRNASAPDRGADEGNFTSNAISVPSCAFNLQPANGTVSLCSYQPLLLKWSAPNTGVPVNLGYDIYFGTNSNPPFLVNVSNLSYSISGLNANTLYYWKVVPKNSVGSAASCNVQTLTTTNALITSTTSASICGEGSMVLNASGSGNILWYNSAVGGSSIQNGSNFNTPFLTNTTTYFVETGSGNYSTYVARPYPSVLEAVNVASSGLVFDAVQPFTLNTVDIYSTASGTMNIQLQSNSGAVLQSASVSLPVGGSSTPKTVTLNFSVPAGTGLRLLQTSSQLSVRETVHPGFPYTLGSLGNITSGFTNGNSSSFYFNFYNWQISSSCKSPRQAVIATVTPTSLTNTTISACDSYTWPVNGITYSTSGIFDVVAQCDTQRLMLTINNSTSSSSNIMAFNNYMWNENGLIYTSSGAYVHTYINSTGCLHTSTLNLIIYSNTINSVSAYQDQSVSCYGSNDGSCQTTVFPSGNYTFQIDGGNQNVTGFFSGLTPGIHTVCVSDGQNTLCDTVMIYEPDSLQIQFVIDSLVSCHGNDGALSAIISGGTTVLQSYLTWWTNTNGDTLNNVLTNNFATSLNNLTADNYQLAIEDDHGCFYTSSTLLGTISPLMVSATFTPIICNGGTSIISPFSSGGSLPIVISINGLAVQANYPAGIYTILATDASACTSQTVISITEPATTNSSLSIAVCDSYTWNENGITYTISGTYTSSTVNSAGCIGMATLHLIIHQSYSSSLTVSAVNTYTWSTNGISYTSSGTYFANYVNVDGCDSILTLNLTITGVAISPKVFLTGPYNQYTGLMYDSLRVNNLIPLIEPYSFPPFSKPQLGGIGGETISNNILSIAGNNAIVDWIFIELRAASNPAILLATKRALLQRDGDIVSSSDGISSIYFDNMSQGNYYISIKHRNHLGVMTAMPIPLNYLPTIIDFTSSIPVYTINSIVYNAPRKIVNSIYVLWAGDANNNKNVKYNGTANDKDAILFAIGAGMSNNILSGYRIEDVNMDGKVKYNNADNDKNFILSQLGSNTPNRVFYQHMTD